MDSETQQGPKGSSFSSDLSLTDSTSFACVGSTGSGVANSEENALEKLRLTQVAMQKYLSVEMESKAEEWKLLGNCTSLLQDHCQNVRNSVKESIQHLESTTKEMERLRPQFNRIEEVEKQLVTLMQTVNKIDEYSKVLADRFDCS